MHRLFSFSSRLALCLLPTPAPNPQLCVFNALVPVDSVAATPFSWTIIFLGFDTILLYSSFHQYLVACCRAAVLLLLLLLISLMMLLTYAFVAAETVCVGRLFRILCFVSH